MQTVDEVKEYLNQVRDGEKQIDYKQDLLLDLRGQATKTRSVSYSGIRVQTSHRNDSMERIISKIVDLEEEIQSDIGKIRENRKRVSSTIDLLPDANEKIVLRSIYFEDMTVSQIADSMYLCKRSVQRIHKNALEHLLKLMQDMEG